MPPAAGPQTAPSPFSPFRHTVFAVVWTATVVSNIGGWMSSAASGWLMTSLSPDPFIVSLVQVATTMPMFLFAIPAGALTDIFDKRKFLIFGELSIMIVSIIFAMIVWLDLATPINLIVFTFLSSLASTLTWPAWYAVVPQLVPKRDLNPAIAANSAGVNVSRAIGPALGGIMVARIGIAAPFWCNAFSNAGVIAALLWWRSSPSATQHLPVERFFGAMRVGFRHARNNPQLMATLIRAVAFFLFASAYWALLPLVTRNQVAGGPDLYGYLLGTIGAAAVGTTFALPWLKAKLGSDRLVAAGTVGTAIAMTMFGTCIGGERHSWRILDCGYSEPQRLRSTRPSGLGARPRTCNICYSVLWSSDPGQCALGANCRDRRTICGTFPGRRRRYYRAASDEALEAANGYGR
jgi:MFS family permease